MKKTKLTSESKPKRGRPSLKNKQEKPVSKKKKKSSIMFEDVVDIKNKERVSLCCGSCCPCAAKVKNLVEVVKNFVSKAIERVKNAL